jgi:hypothetical protein
MYGAGKYKEAVVQARILQNRESLVSVSQLQDLRPGTRLLLQWDGVHGDQIDAQNTEWFRIELVRRVEQQQAAVNAADAIVPAIAREEEEEEEEEEEDEEHFWEIDLDDVQNGQQSQVRHHVQHFRESHGGGEFSFSMDPLDLYQYPLQRISLVHSVLFLARTAILTRVSSCSTPAR